MINWTFLVGRLVFFELHIPCNIKKVKYINFVINSSNKEITLDLGKILKSIGAISVEYGGVNNDLGI